MSGKLPEALHHAFEDSPLTKKNFRPSHLPALRAESRLQVAR